MVQFKILGYPKEFVNVDNFESGIYNFFSELLL